MVAEILEAGFDSRIGTACPYYGRTRLALGGNCKPSILVQFMANHWGRLYRCMDKRMGLFLE
jgi:hypothetical protein